jgi:serine kinase of HPr protein (carbohydrate metabolism regulator)
MRRCGIYELHSAAVLDPQTKAGVIFVGPSGSGKSTITLQLAAAGWPYLTDDILLLSRENGIVEAKPLRRAFAVTESSVSASGHAVLAESIGRFENYGESKKRFSPHDFFTSGFASSCVPGVIYFPAVTRDGATRVRPLSQSETMIRLLKMCPWASYDRGTGSTHLQILATLARQCAAYDLNAGRDVITDPSLLPRLFATRTPGD